MPNPPLSSYIAPVLGIAVTTSASIAFEGIATRLTPTDIKALPAFGIKITVAVIGGLLAGKIAQIVVDNVESVRETVKNQTATEEVIVPSDEE